MQVPICFVADAANVSVEGKVNMVGQFEEIRALGFPVRHPQLAMWLQLLAEPFDIGREAALEVRLVDADGQQILSVTRAITPPPPPIPDAWPVKLNVIVWVQDVVFPTAGAYEFRILLDAEDKARATLTVRQVQ
ncbi:MAG TPA: hypothetical protein VKU60_11455 [Chloroflexota bacterium]|nr:hypothetical protein [Chloroflexota bacterium]